jgi:uncharacterized protein (TIGR02246 family)
MARFTALALLACAFVCAQPARASDLRGAIEAQNAAFRTAFLAGDAEKVASLYSADAQVIAPGAPIASGRAAIAAFWKGGMAGVKELKLATTGVEGVGELAVEDGVVTLTGADGATSSSRYLVVWKREGGQWRLHRDIWNAEK